MLIMSGGSLVGQNVLDALADRRAGVKLVATNSVATDISLFDFDAAYLVPPTLDDPPAFETRFLDILAEEDPHLVVPCRDDDVVFLADQRERRPELADRLLCGDSDAARATCDKVASWRFARDNGLPFAPSLAKPRRGYASRGVFLVVDEVQLSPVAACRAPGGLRRPALSRRRRSASQACPCSTASKASRPRSRFSSRRRARRGLFLFVQCQPERHQPEVGALRRRDAAELSTRRAWPPLHGRNGAGP